MAKKPFDTPMLDQLESGPWPSFVTGLKRLAKDKDYMVDLMGQLEHSYKTRKGYWKGGTGGDADSPASRCRRGGCRQGRRQ